jgi:hypothetical protein
VKVLGGKDHIELAVDFDDIAFTELAGDDFQGKRSSIMRGAARRPERVAAT